ncbi:hypothetical protein [Staphylococcus simulans]|uniref:hypothetical protein n=1 Tax=Staphylococcus simulans TaxID=1286 RepID=UPI003CF138F4
MENNERKNNEAEMKIIKLHFKYTASILLGISVLVLAIVFFDKEIAVTYLTYAGTTLSLVLSVIAILITLIDVAGQKKQVYEIYNTSEELKALVKQHEIATNNMKNSLENQQGNLELYQKNIDNVDSVIKELIDSLNNANNINKQDDEDKEVIENDNGITNANTLKHVSSESEIINNDFFTQKYKTIKVSNSLNEEQEKEIDGILKRFTTIRVKFNNNSVELYSRFLGVSPFVDSDYEKHRAYILIKRYLESENLTI